MLRLAAILQFLVFCVGLLPAQTPYQPARLKAPITLDGVIAPGEWPQATPLPLYMHAPNFGGAPTEKTEVYLGYDDSYLYLAGRLYYEDLQNLQSTSKKRDALEGSTDYFGLVIDSFNDKENGLGFFTTPAGLRFDATVFNDAQGDFPVNLSWNTFWDVAVKVTDQGWFAEIRVPFTSLRFQNKNGDVTLGLTAWRYMASKNEILTFPNVRNDLGPWSLWKPSQMQEVALVGVYSKKPAYIAPYLLSGMQRSSELATDELSYLSKKDFQLEAGLDLKYSLSSNFTMDVTANPDFAQVEADDQQVNLTRFSLFFPEKRLFFQERSSIFDFRLGGPNRLFYSRRIGIYDDQPSRIYGGARVIGRAGPWDIGFLNMQTEKVGDQSSANYGVLRMRRQTINQFSYLGGIITNQIDTDGRFNTAVGLDGTIRVFGFDYFEFNFAQTYYDDVTPAPFAVSNAKFRLNWENRSSKGLGYNLGVSRVGEDYNPEMGFEVRENYTRYGDRIWWGWIPGEKSKILNHQLYLTGFAVLKNSSRKTESAEISPGWQFNSKSGFFGDFALKYRVENLADTFELSDVAHIPIGNYNFAILQATFNTSFSKRIAVNNTITAGSFFDGTQIIAGISPVWKVTSSLDFGLDYLFNRINFSDRNQSFEAHLIRLRSSLMLSTKLSTTVFMQHNSADNISLGNFRLRYNPREGNDLFIVYNHSLNSHRGRETPHLPLTDNQTLVLKYTYTFVTGN